MFPFRETKVKNNIVIREFSEDTDSEELIWHLDREDRTVRVLESNGWKLQLDNQLPVLLEGKKEYKIPKYMWLKNVRTNDRVEKVPTKRDEHNAEGCKRLYLPTSNSRPRTQYKES
jgi:hypothetical protein